MSVYQDKATGKYYFVCTYKDWQGKSHRKYTRGFKLARDDIVNIGLHFFHKDVRLMLPLVVKHSIVAA